MVDALMVSELNQTYGNDGKLKWFEEARDYAITHI